MPGCADARAGPAPDGRGHRPRGRRGLRGGDRASRRRSRRVPHAGSGAARRGAAGDGCGRGGVLRGGVAAAWCSGGAVTALPSVFVGSSAARREATTAGVRYLAMPGVRMETFRDDGPLAVDFDAIRADAERVGAAWAGADAYRLTTPAGTDLRGSVAGRPGRVLHGLAREAGDYMAPPDIEAGTAPVEGSSSGVVVVDADLLFMGTGPLPSPVALHVRDGELAGVEGDEGDRLTDMLDRCADPRMVNLAEASVAFNPNGRVCGVAMETESARGTAHVAFGNSIAYGGTVDAIAHLDCVMRDATLELDGAPVIVSGALA